MTAQEYRQALDALPYGKRLPGAVYLVDPGDAATIPSLLRISVAELRKRLEIGPEFNLLKFHTASPKISFLAYPDFEKSPHPALQESVIVDLITGKVRRDDYRGRANPPILHRKETFPPPDHPLHAKFAKLTRQALLVSTLIAGHEAYDVTTHEVTMHSMTTGRRSKAGSNVFTAHPQQRKRPAEAGRLAGDTIPGGATIHPMGNPRGIHQFLSG